MDQNNGELDRILDEGLATYSSSEPRPGLEERVLSRLANSAAPKRGLVPVWLRGSKLKPHRQECLYRNAATPKSQRSWRWAILALPAAACLLLAVSVVWRKQ